VAIGNQAAEAIRIRVGCQGQVGRMFLATRSALSIDSGTSGFGDLVHIGELPSASSLGPGWPEALRVEYPPSPSWRRRRATA